MSLTERIQKAAQYFKENGLKLEYVAEVDKKIRVSICEGCPQFNHALRNCGICHCFMDFKASLKYDPVEGLAKGTKVLTKCAAEPPKW